MRAPGAPTAEEIESVRKGSLRKVDYYHSKYASFREGIHPHAVRVEGPSMFSEFLSTHPIDYAFVCIDQLTEGESPRQDAVYCALSKAGIPFIDSGVSITIEEHAVRGAVTTSAYEAGSVAWKEAIPNARVKGQSPGLSQRPAARSERVRGVSGRYGVAATYGAVCLGVLFIPAPVSTRDAPDCRGELTCRSSDRETSSRLRRRNARVQSHQSRRDLDQPQASHHQSTLSV